MAKQFDYTDNARNFASNHPLLSFIFTQVSFWVLSCGFFIVLLHLQLLSFKAAYSLPSQDNVGRNFLLATILGVTYGVILGLTDYVLDRRYFRTKSLGLIVIIKTVIFSVVMLAFFVALRYVLFDMVINPMQSNRFRPPTEESWRYFFYVYCFYNFFMILLITFINQVNRKFGTGVLLPLLLGKYRKPHAEERVFMFMDLKSSTTIAEYMGHMRYSEFISDSFMDINHILPKYKAEIYQYVGDEIVLSWKVNSTLSYDKCVEFFYACENEFKKRRPYYIKKYHEVPTFKVGLHAGIVSAVEIGEMKRDIAYHGDTLNITARIQSLCNSYGKKLLASAEFVEKCTLSNGMVATPVGSTLLKGKTVPVSIFSIEPVQVSQYASRRVLSDSI